MKENGGIGRRIIADIATRRAPVRDLPADPGPGSADRGGQRRRRRLGPLPGRFHPRAPRDLPPVALAIFAAEPVVGYVPSHAASPSVGLVASSVAEANRDTGTHLSLAAEMVHSVTRY